MAEESVRVASSHVATTYARVNELSEEMKEWKRLNPEYLFDRRLKAIYKDKDQDLKEARADLKEARADLKEAREYHLRLTQPVQTVLQTDNVFREKLDMLQDIIQTRLPNPNTPSSFSTTALGQIAMKRIARNFCKHPPTLGDPILTEVGQWAIKADILEKELVVEMTKHFNRILPRTGYPLVFVNSEDFGWLEQHPNVSRNTDMKPDGFVTFRGLFCHREKHGHPADFKFGTPFAKLLDSIVIFEGKRIIDDSALEEVSRTY
jgi:hypothetical protein